jgi:hypothetical protein
MVNTLAYVIGLFISDEEKKSFLTLTPVGQFYKNFTCVTKGLNKINCTIHFIHAPMNCFQNAQAYLVAAVSYAYEMFMK